MTNYEKMKQMSIEEMAYSIMCPYGTDPDMCGKNDCIRCTKEWLEMEAGKIKRFTKKSVIGGYELEACFSCYPGKNSEKCGLCKVMREAIDRLGEYEEAEENESKD